MDDGSITLLVALIVLIAFSAFFSASETAFSSLNQIRLKSRAEEGDTSAARVLAMAEKYDKLLSSILIGNNIVNIAAASIGTVLFTKWLGAERGATTSTMVLTVVVLIFGEVTPKTLAKEMPETIATAVSPVLNLLMTLFTPLTWLFSQWKKLLGRFVHSSESDAITEGELITMVSEAENDGELTDRESQLIRSAIEFDDVEVEEILTPRVDVVAVEDDISLEELAQTFAESGYSRLPVYHDTVDNIIGVVHEKDFYIARLKKSVTMEDLTVSYDALSDRYGVRVVRDTIVGLDADRRTVIGEKGRYAYDKLIVSPGIELLYEGIPGYSAELAATKIPSGWIAGPQTQLLADQLKAMPQGGTFCLVAPPNPYRCPPGPYERAALVTEWCAKHNPTAKIIVTDPKNNFVTDETMLLGWNRLYGFSIPADYKARLDKYASPARPDCRLEWVQEKQGGRPLAIDASAMTVTTEAGVIKADVINVIPPMRAANVALAMGLADKTGFCPIDRRTFESTIIPDVYVLGDASIADAMPKSGFSANTQAKTTARAIVEELAGREITEPVWSNTCYALAGEDYGLFVADVFRIMDGKIGRTNTRARYQYLKAQPAEQALAAQYLHSWMNTITADSFG